MSGATIRVLGLEAALKTVRGMPQTVASRVPEIVGTVIVAGIKANFVRGTDPDTKQKWAALKSRNGAPLRDKGGLQRSIHYERTGRGVSVGTNLIYAATHQFGDPNRVPVKAHALRFKVFGVFVFAQRVTIPQRKFLPDTDAGVAFVAPAMPKTIEEYLKKQFDASTQGVKA